MSNKNQFTYTPHAYQDTQMELRPNVHTLSATLDLSASNFLFNQGNILPSGSLRLGLTEDGFPLLFDLYNPAPGPLRKPATGLEQT